MQINLDIGTPGDNNRLQISMNHGNKKPFLLTLALATLANLLAQSQARSQDLLLITNPPYLGTYYSLAFTNWPALPILPFDVPVYLLYTDPTNGPIYAYDDRFVDYSMMTPMTDTSDAPAPGPLDANYIGGDCGCAPWLTIAPTGSNAVLVTVHRLVAGQTCNMYSSTNITVPFTNWAFETNVTAAVGPATALIPMASRSNLFFRARAEAYQATNYIPDTNSAFTGLTVADAPNAGPPDTMGASGGSDVSPLFLEMLNDAGKTKAVYDPTGELVAYSTNGDDFLGATIDAHVVWDPHARRWFVSSLGSGVSLGVSRSENPADLTPTNWYTYRLDLSGVSWIDFDTLGFDDNGVYISVIRFTNYLGSNLYAGNTILAIKKPEILQGVLITNRFDFYNTNTLSAPGTIIQPVVNFDPVPTNGYAWFLTKGAPQFGSSYLGGSILYSRLQWSGINATLDRNWQVITNAGPTYRDYFDLDIQSVSAPQPDGGTIQIWPIGSRLATSSIRGGSLWTCYPVGLNGTNGAFTNATYADEQSYTNVDRTGVQWLNLTVNLTNGSLDYTAHGRVYDRSVSDAPLWYLYPSIMANCAGDMVMGFSGCGLTNYVSAFYSWRLANGASMTTPGLIRAGTTNSAISRWGDYSATSIDPADDRSFWTVQEIARLPVDADPFGTRWETVIARLKPAR